MKTKLDINDIDTISTDVIIDNSSTEKNKGGRPRKIFDKVDKKISVYFSSKEVKSIKEFCEDNNLQVSSFIRNTVNKAIK